MKLSSRRHLRRQRRKLIKYLKSKRQALLLQTKLFKRISYLIIAISLGYLLSKTQIVITQPTDSSQNLIANASQQENAMVAELKDQPTQSNVLFSTKPSWRQNFADYGIDVINPQYWNTVVGPAPNTNNEQQYYTSNPTNLRIDGGVLKLVAAKEIQPGDYSYSSARIETNNKQTFLYGRLDIIAKLPKGTGTWPAVWMLPANKQYADKSPVNSIYHYKNGGEIDIIESVGHHPDIVYAVTHVASDVVNRPDGTGSNGFVKVPNSSVDFNKYSLLWTPNSLEFMVNDQVFYTYTRLENADYTTWPYDQPFYLIVNLSLGGNWGGMDQKNFPGTGIDDSALPTSFDIKSIDYYPYIGQ